MSRSHGLLCLCAAVLAGVLAGCSGSARYSNASLYPEGISNVYVEMFDNSTFRRGIEYTLSDALAKRIEALTPYKIVSDRDQADSVISGQITAAGESVLTLERDLGVAMEKEAVLTVGVSWKNLKTGRLMINNRIVTAAAGYSSFQGQDFTYASAVAANKLAQKIVELMENPW